LRYLPVAIKTLLTRAPRCTSTALANSVSAGVFKLVKKGLPFREAHHLVGQAVKLGPLESLSLEKLQGLSSVFEADVQSLWDFRAAVNRRTAVGGTGTESVREQIRVAQETLK